MVLNRPIANVFVICAAVLQGLAQPAQSEPIDALMEPQAYEIYAIVLQRAWAGHPSPLLLQRETAALKRCGGFLSQLKGDWAEVAADFERRITRPNARARCADQDPISVDRPS